MKQQSQEWHKLREGKIGASDAPVIMGVSPFKTQYKLWEEKLGLSKGYTSAKMERGLQLEDKARKLFCEMTGIAMFPIVKIHVELDWMMASFDGMDAFGRNILEIKCPDPKGDDHKMALDGVIPEKYYPQLQHQMEVADLDMTYYMSFDGEKGCLVECERNRDYIKKMIEKEIEFYKYMLDLIAPPMTGKDYEYRCDDIWKDLTTQWLDNKKVLEEAEKKDKTLREALISLADNKCCMDDNIRLIKGVRKGTIEYSKIPELKSINLDAYRKSPVEYWRLEEKMA